MRIIKKTALQSFSIAVLAIAMVACGGSSDDPTPAANAPLLPASLTTVVDVAKAVAGIQSAKTAFDSVIANNEGILHDTSTGTSNCGTSPSAGSRTVTTHSATANPTDGAIENHLCLVGDEKFDGSLITTCNNASCDDALYVAQNLVWGNTAQAIDLMANGSWRVAASDTFKGSSRITKSGASTTFTFNDGLVQTYPSHNTVTGSGTLTVSGASATNCIDSTYSYTISTPLTTPSGTMRQNGGAIKVSSGGVEAGTVTFNADGSVKVKLKDGTENTVSKAEFESYCGLKEAYDFSQVINSASTL